MDEQDLNLLQLAGQGYCCVQLPLLMLLEAQGRQCPELLRSLGAMCHGFPGGEGYCGALTGGACLLGYFAGKGEAGETEDERLPLMLDLLQQWFREYCQDLGSGPRCADIVQDGQPDTTVCGNLISAVYQQTLGLLVEHGFDPYEVPGHDH